MNGCLDQQMDGWMDAHWENMKFVTGHFGWEGDICGNGSMNDTQYNNWLIPRERDALLKLLSDFDEALYNCRTYCLKKLENFSLQIP